MYSATFIFDTLQFDAAFHTLDAEIAAAARNTEGYLGEEAWEDPKTGRIANVYYWSSEAGLHALMQHPRHLEAKHQYSQWLSGYQVIIAQVLHSYGDGQIAHPTRIKAAAAPASA